MEPIVLLTGERRDEYIEKRLREGATAAEVLGEINAPGRFSGTPGEAWTIGCIYTVQKRIKNRPDPDRLVGEAHAARVEDATGVREGEAHVPAVEVLPEYDGILTAEDILDIQTTARNEILATKRKRAKESLLKKTREALHEQAMKELEESVVATGDFVDVAIDLAPYAPSIVIDGHVFWHGRNYRVLRPVGKGLQEMMARTWAHQNEISGQKSDFARQRDIRIVGGMTNGGGVTIMGAEGLQK